MTNPVNVRGQRTSRDGTVPPPPARRIRAAAVCISGRPPYTLVNRDHQQDLGSRTSFYAAYEVLRPLIVAREAAPALPGRVSSCCPGDGEPARRRHYGFA